MKPITYYVDLPADVANAIEKLTIPQKLSLSKGLIEQVHHEIICQEGIYDMPYLEVINDH
jgi:hypothetical protein